VLRWLLPLLAVLTLLGSSVSAWAAAGFSGESDCCCPVKAKCQCHDHDANHDDSTKFNRCGGEATFAAPAVVPLIVPEAPLAIVVVQTTIEIEQIVRNPDEWFATPDKPPI
jgi:hypothetical protein